MIAHSLRGEGFDASEDGTGRGTPIVPVAPTLRAGGNQTGGNRPYGTDVDTCDSLVPIAPPIASTLPRGAESSGKAGALRENPDAGPDGVGVQEGVSSPLEARAEVQAVSFAQNQRGELRTSDVATQLTTGGGKPGEGYPAVMSQWAVRRLTPTECERLQGVPDGFTQIPWRGKAAADCPDGPRYKALGNSMAVNVMALIGERIDAVQKLIDEGRI